MTTPEKLPKLLILHVGEMFFPEENILQPNYKPDSYLFSNYNSEHLKFFAKFNKLSFPCHLPYFPNAVSKVWPFEIIFIIIFQVQQLF